MGANTSKHTMSTKRINEETLPALIIEERFPRSVTNFNAIGVKKYTKRTPLKQISYKTNPRPINKIGPIKSPPKKKSIKKKTKRNKVSKSKKR